MKNEVHTLQCTCPGTCSGSFSLTYRGYTTDPIPHDAGAEVVKARLEALPLIADGGIDVTLSSGSTVCGTTAVLAAIEFTVDSGDLQHTTVESSLSTVDNAIDAGTELTASDSTIGVSSDFYAILTDGNALVYTASIGSVDATIGVLSDLSTSGSTIAVSSAMYAQLTNGISVTYTTGSSGRVTPLTTDTAYYVVKAPDSAASYLIVLFDTEANALAATMTTDATVIASTGAQAVTSTNSGSATDHQLAITNRVIQPLVDGTTYYVVKAPDSAAKIVLFDTEANALAATMTTDATVIASTGAQAVTSTNSGSATDHQLASSTAPTVMMQTIQQLKCTCTGTCSGMVYLRYDGETTSGIAYDAASTDVETALEALTDISDVTVTSTAATICDASEVTTSITFTETAGNKPKIAVIDALTTDTSKSVEVTSNDGTRIAVECSGRGVCDVYGTCTCYGLNTTSGWKNFSSSNGKFGADIASGTRGDCGWYDADAVSPDDCPETEQDDILTGELVNKSCSGHGYCDLSIFTCSCNPTWTGGACDKKLCPTGRAWFDEASATNVAHALGSECSNKGSCNRATGKCTCQIGWGGAACEMLLCMGSAFNAGVSTDTCSGNGVCKSMKQIAEISTINGASNSYTYGVVPNNANTWDADMLFGCYCDPGFYLEPDRNNSIDYMCSRRPCPHGDNPLTEGRDDEVQMVTCSATSGGFALRFVLAGESQTTGTIAFSATEEDVENALESLSNIGDVTVDFGESSAAACGATAVPIFVTFITEAGDLDLMVATSITGDASVSVSEHLTGRDGQYTEVQTLTCTCSGTPCTSGTFMLSFRSQTTSAIEHDATAVEVMDALRALNSIGTVEVSFSTGEVACSSSGVAINVNFTSEFGDLPILVASSISVTSVTIVEKQQGTKENIECSGQGICDHDTGMCKCFAGFSSSDGFNGEGTRGDCGRMNTAAAGTCTLKSGLVLC
jgi:hypothetical protein